MEVEGGAHFDLERTTNNEHDFWAMLSMEMTNQEITKRTQGTTKRKQLFIGDKINVTANCHAHCTSRISFSFKGAFIPTYPPSYFFSLAGDTILS